MAVSIVLAVAAPATRARPSTSSIASASASRIGAAMARARSAPSRRTASISARSFGASVTDDMARFDGRCVRLRAPTIATIGIARISAAPRTAIKGGGSSIACMRWG